MHYTIDKDPKIDAKIEKDQVPDVKLLDIAEVIAMAAGVYDPFAEEKSYQLKKKSLLNSR